MLLPIVDHLDAMLGSPKRAIGIANRFGDFRVQPPRFCERVQRIERRRSAKRRLAPAVNQLLHLGEEFGFANSATAALQVVARTERLALRIMVANAQRDVADFLDRAEIERTPPDEWPNFVTGRIGPAQYRPPPPEPE